MKTSKPMLLALLALATTCAAQEAPKPATLSPEQASTAKALLGLVGEFTKAFEAADAAAIASTFTKDAQVTDAEGSAQGRGEIQARFADYFATNPKSKIEIRVDALRFLSPDVVIENGHSIIKPVEDAARAETTKYTVIYVREDGKWLQSSLRDEPADHPAVPDRIKELEWLVGDWVTESDQAVVHTTVKWSEDKHFLLRDFSITIEGSTAIKGTQRIGWDPSRKQFRSWLFDSLGGFGEGEWTRTGDQWMIKTRGVGHDGTIATATQILTKMGRDHIRWSSFDRTHGSESTNEAEEITLVRKPPAPKAK
jgi:uncharacterized protein (TIGR02246 family)